MSTWTSAILGAAGLGIVTALQPCPLVNNVAAVSWLSQWADETCPTVKGVICYVLGRIFGFGTVAVILSHGLLSAALAADMLQQSVFRLTGPVLIIAGMMAAGLLPFPFRHRSSPGLGVNPGLTCTGAFLLGVILSLSFCPPSAALFFGALIPLVLDRGMPLLLPAVYAISSAIPVVAAALFLNSGIRLAGDSIWNINTVKVWVPRITGVILILTGIIISLQRIYN